MASQVQKASTMQLSKRPRSKRRSRGAAMLETAVVMPVLVAIWVAGVYAEKACEAKLDAVQTARSQAWGYASANCGTAGGSPSPSPAANVSGGKQGFGGSAPSSVVQGLGSGNGDALSLIMKLASSLLPPFPAAQGSDSRTAAVSKYSSTQTSKMAVICNEAPFDGSLPNFFKEIFFMVTK